LSIARLRQVKQAIEYRKELEDTERLGLIEWQTKAVCLQLAGLAQSKKMAQEMQRIAMDMSIFPPTKSDEPEDAFDPEAEPDYSKMNLKPTGYVMGRLGRLQRPRL